MNQLFQHRYYSLLLALLAGALAALAMAPLHGWYVLFVSLPVLYGLVVFAVRPLKAFALGWVFGFGYFVFGLSWIGNALLVEGNDYAWAWPLAVTGLPALLAFFPALACYFSKRVLHLRRFSGWFGFATFFCAFEVLRGHVFTGFPWNLLGYTWADHLPVLQGLYWSDVYFLSWLTLFWALLPAAVLLLKARARVVAVLFVVLSFGVNLGYGVIALGQNADHNMGQNRDDVNIRLVQANIDQAEKWDGQKMAEHFRRYLNLSESTQQFDAPTIIVWPETALSFQILQHPDALADIVSVLRSYPLGSVLLTGYLRREGDGRNARYANSLIMIDQNANIRNVYDKHHLVPFGEYIPFQEHIPLAPVTGFQGFQAGKGLQTYSTPSGLNYSPLVCYEVLFPGRSVPFTSGKMPVLEPDFIVNVTNDGWYGKSAGPVQHFNMARFRAIESGLPVIRAANTGISGIFAPDGRVSGETEMYVPYAQNLSLPYAGSRGGVWQIYKSLAVLLLLLLSCVGVMFISIRNSENI